MSEINNRNYQLKLIYNDEDLREPKHDEMMLWLQKWAAVPENIAGLFPKAHPRFADSCVEHILEAFELPPTQVTAGRNLADDIRSRFSARYKDDYPHSENYPSRDPLPDAPARSFQFIRKRWEGRFTRPSCPYRQALPTWWPPTTWAIY